jgi:S-adenosylmethionine:diacylglycerol 3-amino-3-carboxypropyl transferase
VVPRPISDFLAGARDVDAFFLSNVFDWMRPEERAALCERVVASASPRAAVVFRNMLSTPPLPASFSERLAVDVAWSQALHRQERSMSYQRVTLGAVS